MDGTFCVCFWEAVGMELFMPLLSKNDKYSNDNN